MWGLNEAEAQKFELEFTSLLEMIKAQRFVVDEAMAQCARDTLEEFGQDTS